MRFGDQINKRKRHAWPGAFKEVEKDIFKISLMCVTFCQTFGGRQPTNSGICMMMEERRLVTLIERVVDKGTFFGTYVILMKKIFSSPLY